MTPADDFLIRSEESFLTGASGYLDAHPGIKESQPRIYVKFQPDGVDDSHVALFDTGGHYCLLDREIAVSVEPRLTDRIGDMALRTAQGTVRGDLYIHQVKLIAEVGKSLAVDCVVLISPDWRGPSLLGYVGMLDRLRFAIDPRTNRFYFGPLD